MIPSSDALQGARERYDVLIKTLTYLGFEIGDVPMIWSTEFDIYSKCDRKNYATKSRGLDRDYTASEMTKKYHDLCADFGVNLDKNDRPIPQNQSVLVDDF